MKTIVFKPLHTTFITIVILCETIVKEKDFYIAKGVIEKISIVLERENKIICITITQDKNKKDIKVQGRFKDYDGDLVFNSYKETSITRLKNLL